MIPVKRNLLQDFQANMKLDYVVWQWQLPCIEAHRNCQLVWSNSSMKNPERVLIHRWLCHPVLGFQIQKNVQLDIKTEITWNVSMKWMNKPKVNSLLVSKSIPESDSWGFSTDLGVSVRVMALLINKKVIRIKVDEMNPKLNEK